MDNSKSVIEFWKLFSEQKWNESKKLLHSDFSAYWPQTKEKFSGIENYVGMNAEYPGHSVFEIMHVVQKNDVVVSTTSIKAEDTGQTAIVTSYFEFLDGLIYKATEYWADYYDAPDSRKKWRN